MKELAIKCRDSIGPIKLGDSREQVRAALQDFGLSLNSSHGASDYFGEASVQVEYAGDGTAWFIGINSNTSNVCTYKGVNVFDTPAEDLFSLMAVDETNAAEFDEDGYVFPDQILTLWDADPQYDRLGGEVRPIWGQVGIGDDRYLAATAKYR
jgi:hypothetical protein